MTVRNPLRILDELDTEQLQRILGQLDQSQPADSNSCPLALGLERRVTNYATAAAAIAPSYVARHPKSDGMVLRDWVERFIDWWDDPMGYTEDGQQRVDGGLVIQRRKTVRKGVAIRLAKRGVTVVVPAWR